MATAVDLFQERNLPANLLRFGAALREVGLPVTPARMIEATRAIGLIDLGDPGDLHSALRLILVDRRAQLPIFDAVFHEFWLHGPPVDRALTGWDTPDGPSEVTRGPAQILQAIGGGDAEPAETLSLPVYSPSDDLAERDFAGLSPAEADRMAQLVTQIAKRLVTRPGRRRKAAMRGPEIDLRRTIRTSFKYGGLPVELARRRRRPRRGPIVVLCDVSRSMAAYSRFLLQFIHGLQNSPGKVESFVFSTRLFRVTPLFRNQPIDPAFRQIRLASRDWAGGTRIGRGLGQFVQHYAPRVLTRRTVVIILSDGLDTGDLDELDRAMAAIRWRAGKIIWLNPLAGDVRYEPLAGGMRTALPYLDRFAAAHNLQSLAELRELL